MNKTQLIGLGICVGLALVLFAEETNKTNALPKSYGTNANTQEAKTTNVPISLLSQKDLISKTDTNGIMSLPLVQQMIHQAFQQGIQYGVAASIANKTLVQMEDADALNRAAFFLRFGVPRK